MATRKPSRIYDRIRQILESARTSKNGVRLSILDNLDDLLYFFSELWVFCHTC